MAVNYVSRWLIKVKPTGLCTSSIQLEVGQAYIAIYFLPTYLQPMCDQAHPVQMGQPTLFIELKIHGLPSDMNNSSQHSRELSVPRQVGLAG